MTDTAQLLRILNIMKSLRDPDNGCPWDIEQTFTSIAPYTIEEAYEVADAIENGDMATLKDELGDLLLQVVFHAQMAEEKVNLTFSMWPPQYLTKWNGVTHIYLARRNPLGQMKSNPTGKTLKHVSGRKSQPIKRPACLMMCPPPCPVCRGL